MLSLHARCFAISRTSEPGCLAVLSPVWLVWGLGGSPPAAQGTGALCSPQAGGTPQPCVLPAPFSSGECIFGDKLETRGSVLSPFLPEQQS